MDTVRHVFVLMVAAFLFVVVGSPSMAAEDPNKAFLLRGVDAVYVQVKDFDADLNKELRKAGLVADQLQIRVEKKLQEAGITVQSEQQFRKAATKVILFVTLEVVLPEAVQKARYTFTEEGEQVRRPDDDPKYAYRTDVTLRQNVCLLRDPSAQGMAVTWSAGSVGFRRLIRVQADLMDQVDKFVDAYKAVNPR